MGKLWEPTMKKLIFVALGSFTLLSAAPRTCKDQETAKKIRSTLSSGHFKDVKFQIKNGNVVLQGYTDSLENRIELAKAILNIDGVNSVNNQLNVFLCDASDREVDAKIKELISSNQDYQNINYKVSKGKVFLSGFAGTEDIMSRAEEGIKKIPGVMSIENKITLKKV
jgi:osmotically-inducible protein OsmY